MPRELTPDEYDDYADRYPQVRTVKALLRQNGMIDPRTSLSADNADAILATAARERREEEELAAEARHGGRYITEALAKTLQGWDANPGLRARFAGEDGPEKLSEIWRYTASPSGSQEPSGRDTTARYAQGQAANGGVEWTHRAYWLAQSLPEDAFAWPIYRAAMQAETYADLWGQASSAEEHVLDTLARCAGITTPAYLTPTTPAR